MTKGELVELADAARKAGAEFRFGREVPDEDQLLSLYHAVNHNEPGNLADHFGDPDYPVRVAIRAAWLAAFFHGFTRGWGDAQSLARLLGPAAANLNEHQAAILSQIAAGKSYEAIAEHRHCHPETVRYHVRAAAAVVGMTVSDLRRKLGSQRGANQ